MNKTNRVNVLGLVLWLWVMLVGLVPAQDVRTLMVRSNGVLATPTNFFAVNSNLLREVVGAGSITNAFRVVNVQELGAVGDGTTDDSAAIQRAINLASTNDLALAEVYFPPGKYKVTTSLIIPSNCPTTVLKASTGPLRMFGAGSSSSVILSYVTEGATLNATCPGDYANNMGLKLERLGLIGPAVRDVNQTGHSIGLNLGWHDDTSAGQNQYRGDSIMLQDVAVDGFYMAITSTNVWGLTVDNCMFQSNQVAALALSKTHSAIIRNTSIRGVDLAGRFTGTAIGFYAPRGSDTSWGFGDTALLMGVRTYFCTNAIYNDELQLTDIGGNYQFSHTFYTIRSGMRTNAVVQKWHPWATLNGVVFCDSTTAYHNGGNATARCETDSAAAPFITLINYMGDVCVPGNRTEWNVLGATPSDGNVDSTSGYWTFGTANAAQPQVIGGKNLNATLNSGATFTFYTMSNLIALATAGIVTNNASGLTLSGTWSGNVSLVDGASEASISREGDTTAFLDFTLGDYSARQTTTNWQFYLPLVADASGLTNFSRPALAASGAVTNMADANLATATVGDIAGGSFTFHGKEGWQQYTNNVETAHVLAGDAAFNTLAVRSPGGVVAPKLTAIEYTNLNGILRPMAVKISSGTLFTNAVLRFDSYDVGVGATYLASDATPPIALFGTFGAPLTEEWILAISGSYNLHATPSGVLLPWEQMLWTEHDSPGWFANGGTNVTWVPTDNGDGGFSITNGVIQFDKPVHVLGNVSITGAFRGNGSGLTNLPSSAITNAPWISSTSNAWTGTFTGNGSGLTNLNVSTATGLLPMGTVATQYQTAPGPFLSTNSGARGYSYNAGSLTNLQSPRSGSATYTLTDNTEKFISWSGTVSSSGETYAAAPMALGGAFSKFYLAINQIGAGGTNITVKIYTNGTYCGLGAVLQGPGARTNDLSTVTGVVPDGAVVSVGIQSSYNGVHPSMYFRWSWVSTK